MEVPKPAPGVPVLLCATVRTVSAAPVVALLRAMLWAWGMTLLTRTVVVCVRGLGPRGRPGPALMLVPVRVAPPVKLPLMYKPPQNSRPETVAQAPTRLMGVAEGTGSRTA